MRNLDAPMVSNQFTVLVPLDEVYQKHMPRDRNMVLVWLNGMVSPYSIALAVLNVRVKTRTDASQQLWDSLDWLPNPAERQVTYDYINTIVGQLELYVLPILHQEGYSLDTTSLSKAHETVVDEWSCGHVTLTFNLHGQGQTNRVIGTPYLAQQYLATGAPLVAGPAQIPNNHFYNYH